MLVNLLVFLRQMYFVLFCFSYSLRHPKIIVMLFLDICLSHRPKVPNRGYFSVGIPKLMFPVIALVSHDCNRKTSLIHCIYPFQVRPDLEQGVVADQSVPSNPSLSNRRPPPHLQCTGIVLVQPPARITALGLAETPSLSAPSDQCAPYGLLVALGTPHGYSVVHLPPVKPPPSAPSNVQTLWIESTLPDNLDALQEAAAGEGWARRRTRELKKSLRDSFRRLKRMRSRKTSGHPHAVISVETPAPASSAINRAGVRRTVTQVCTLLFGDLSGGIHAPTYLSCYYFQFISEFR